MATLLVAMLIAGCGVTVAPPSPSSPSSHRPPTPSPSLSASADVAVVRIEQSGGMLPPWETLNWLPSVVLYADGRLMTQGAMIEIYPGPALPSLQVSQLTPHGVAQVLQAALDSGFFGPDRDIGEQMLDAGSTVFTITTADGTHVTRLHGPSQDPQVVAALRFAEAMLAPRDWFEGAVVGDDRAYEWDRLQIVFSPMTADDTPDPALVTEVAWPLEPLATLGLPLEDGEPYRCGVVEGDDLEALRPALESANQLTLFESAGETYSVRLRPLLPGEDGCKPLAG